MISSLAFTLLQQQQPAGGGRSGMALLLFQIGAIALVFYFLIIRPQSKARKQHAELLKGLKKGDDVVTSGGIMGKVRDIKDDRVTVESGDASLVIRRDRIVQIGNAEAPGAGQG